MKRRALVAAVASLALIVPCLASKLEREMDSRWRGAWVILKVAVQSDCAGMHTDNLVSGALVSSKGRFAFRPGELARVDKVDLHRSRIDLILSLPEPILVASQDGPFTLYDEVRCPIEIDVDVPRDRIAKDDVGAIDGLLQNVAERHATMDEARTSRAWNQRKRDPYPPDYTQTLAAHQAWKAEQVNAGIQERLDRALEETTRLTDRLTSDRDYLAGFAAGVEAMKAVDLTRCGDLMARDFKGFAPAPPSQTAAARPPEAQQRWARGYQDGERLIFGLESLRHLPACFIQVPAAQNAAQRRPLP